MSEDPAVSPSQIEALARELCMSEGWDPDEVIACEDLDESFGHDPELLNATRTCQRWQPYAQAAKRLLTPKIDDWDTF